MLIKQSLYQFLDEVKKQQAGIGSNDNTVVNCDNLKLKEQLIEFVLDWLITENATIVWEIKSDHSKAIERICFEQVLLHPELNQFVKDDIR